MPLSSLTEKMIDQEIYRILWRIKPDANLRTKTFYNIRDDNYHIQMTNEKNQGIHLQFSCDANLDQIAPKIEEALWKIIDIPYQEFDHQ